MQQPTETQLLRHEICEFRKDLRCHVSLTLKLIVATSLGLAGLMAKGFDLL